MAIFDIFKRKKEEVTTSQVEKKDPVEHEINTIVIQDSARGSSGTEIYSGYYDEEYLEELKTSERAKVFDKMERSDPQIKMILSAVKNPIRTASKEIHAASDERDHQSHAALCEKVIMEDVDIEKYINEALDAITQGFSVFERVHKINSNNPVSDKEGNLILSAYIGYKKLGWRSPKTIEAWNYDKEKKELVSIRQIVDGDLAVDIDIPAKFLTILTIDLKGDNLEGVSMIRSCYGSWFRKNTYLKLNAIGIEKSMPTPTAEVPNGKLNTAEYTNLIDVLEKFTTHQKNYITYPQGWNVNLSDGTKYEPDRVEKSIDSEDKRMAKAFLANFLELGLSGTGAYSLSNDLSDFFLSGLMYIANLIKKSLDDMCKEITILNFGKQDKYPTFKFSGIDDKAGKELAEIIKMMIDGKVIIPDDNLEDHIRKRINVSPKSEDGQREAGQGSMGFLDSNSTLSERIKFAIESRKTLKMME
jgi:hypothetical protein